MNSRSEEQAAARPSGESRPVFRTTLQSQAHSASNRRRASDLAWRWVNARWPRLMPTDLDLDIDGGVIDRQGPGQRLCATSTADGATWILQVSHTDRNGGRTWTTRASVVDTGETDQLTLQTECTHLDRGPRPVIAPPKLLAAWVQRLALEDGGVPIVPEPHRVTDEARLEAFCDHVLLPSRGLPIVVLTSKAKSRYYGVDPQGLAEVLCGMAHVVCLTAELAARTSHRLGRLVPHPGLPRIYGLQFHPDAAPGAHPLIRQEPPTGTEQQAHPGAMRRLICSRVCEISVAPADEALTA